MKFEFDGVKKTLFTFSTNNLLLVKGVKVMDKKTMAVLALLGLVTFGVVGWVRVATRSTSDNLPAENQTVIFPGYENYLNRELYYITASGTSMEPTFGDGDVVIWVQVDPTELNVGDVIIYEHPTYPSHENVAHRIIEVRVRDGVYGFRTQGDNRAEPDKYWVEEELIGLVIGVIYQAGS